MLKYAIIGFGGLGKMHFKNMIQIEEERKDIQLVAIYGDKSSFVSNVQTNLGNSSSDIDLSKFNLYTDLYEMFKNEKLDFVLSVLPTYLHEETAVIALKQGVHVFSEKPMARTLEECQRMVDTAKKHNKKLMIGQCLRFDSAYAKIKEYIENETYGKVLRAEFKRYSPKPLWTFNNWILDFEKSGGCALDMHVHEVDMINYLFGRPKSVLSSATHNKYKFESIFTTYEYEGIHVTSAADWSLPSTYPLKAHFIVVFENAIVEYKDNKLVVYQDGEKFEPKLDDENFFVKELKEFVATVSENRESEIISPKSTMQSIEIALAEIKSAETGKKVELR